MKLAVACDHAGFELKEKVKRQLESEGHGVEDFGCYNTESCDYPDYARKLCEAVLGNMCERGVLICGSGLGMSYTANRYKGIRAALCLNTYMAEMSRAHNNSNVLVLGSRIIDFPAAKDILRVWMETPFEGGRHLRRIRKIDGEE
ncbi:MAG: ribose 5-phosphate isomerase B [Candidatus Abyssobacteria bacterium SURF_17]|jgi:ribose 5-phosphate isomerase B|uniref:Ribose 5-phosphate isomerase B n=1 Tax=Candidatus Abyssobacteria bacterium SURF_17 TaxID=2093361 RepID=A0A419ESW2_9BACT|nr:MAG: ribose 5-phosphate isomerase B [Candidatus Abyssubacteria bacterium SURF_17]